jgi:hypothetical protein
MNGKIDVGVSSYLHHVRSGRITLTKTVTLVMRVSQMLEEREGWNRMTPHFYIVNIPTHSNVESLTSSIEALCALPEVEGISELSVFSTLNQIE